MTPEEKLHWFWTLGTVPGSIFDTLNERQSIWFRAHRRRHVRQPGHGSQNSSHYISSQRAKDRTGQQRASQLTSKLYRRR